jgi:hypothetical protein
MPPELWRSEWGVHVGILPPEPSTLMVCPGFPSDTASADEPSNQRRTLVIETLSPLEVPFDKLRAGG